VSREEQGLPPQIEDPAALADIAVLFAPYLEPAASQENVA
jgi:hypothetical protein